MPPSTHINSEFGIRNSELPPPTRFPAGLECHPEDSTARVGRHHRQIAWLGRNHWGAPKGRRIHSLGREPQVRGDISPWSPEGATDFACGASRRLRLPIVCRRFRLRAPRYAVTGRGCNLRPPSNAIRENAVLRRAEPAGSLSASLSVSLSNGRIGTRSIDSDCDSDSDSDHGPATRCHFLYFRP